MSALQEIVGWVAVIGCTEAGAGRQPGRFELSQRDLAAARMRAHVHEAGPDMRFFRIIQSISEDQLLDQLVIFGTGTICGIAVRVVDACEPPLRYIPHRDPLLFGASA